MLKQLLHLINIDAEIEDYDKIHIAIERDSVFKGTNLWILVFAIILASIGLNMNSTAVIIGAMLISPLMGPINGMGYSIATYNFGLFRRAARHFTFAVVISLTASTVYFALSPVSAAHSELLARTSPTIYDVLIALFGGLAGIVAISSTQKGNVIPGVAIATALMPPLCTAGYGLATAQFGFFFGAIYLFTINTVFIAISSVAFSQILRFPIRTVVDNNRKTVINRWITVVIVATVFPSIYFGYTLVQKEAFLEHAAAFTATVSVLEGNFLLKQDIQSSNRTIRLVYGGKTLTETQKKQIQDRALDFSLADAVIDIQQGFSFDDIRRASTERENLRGEINRLSLQLRRTESQRDSLADRTLMGKHLLSEIQSLFPQIVSCSYSEALVFRGNASEPSKQSIVILGSARGSLSEASRRKILLWLRMRLGTDAVQVFF